MENHLIEGNSRIQPYYEKAATKGKSYGVMSVIGYGFPYKMKVASQNILEDNIRILVRTRSKVKVLE